MHNRVWLLATSGNMALLGTVTFSSQGPGPDLFQFILPQWKLIDASPVAYELAKRRKNSCLNGIFLLLACLININFYLPD